MKHVTKGEGRISMGGHALRRLRRGVAKDLHRNPLYRQLALGGPPPELLDARLPELRQGNAVRGRALIGGAFAHGDDALTDFNGPMSLWDDWTSCEASFAWLHRFTWLRDVVACRNSAGDEMTQAAVDGWISRFGDWHEEAWSPEIAGRRILCWLAAGDVLFDTRAGLVRKRLDSLGRQVRHLERALGVVRPGLHRITACAALVAAGVCLSGMRKALELGLDGLVQEIEAQIYLDGGHVSRSPEVLVDIASDLYAVEAVLAAASIRAPQDIRRGIDRISPMLRFFTLSDGQLASFHGGSQGDRATLAALARAGERSGFRPGGALAMPQSGMAQGPELAQHRAQHRAEHRAHSRAGGAAMGRAVAPDTHSDEASIADNAGSGARSGPGRTFDYAPHSGYHRVCAGGASLVFDTGAPADGAFAARAHASCLAFEFAPPGGRLFVNCGWSGHHGGALRQPTRATSAHSTVTLADTNSFRLPERPSMRPAGAGRRPVNVTSRRNEEERGVWVEGSHEGYLERHGLVHRRALFMNSDGTDLRGEDVIFRPMGRPAPPRAVHVPYTVRFHLHPDVRPTLAADLRSVVLVLPTGEAWRMRSDAGALAIEQSIFLSEAGAAPRATRQIVITGEADHHGALDAPPNRIRWALNRLGRAVPL